MELNNKELINKITQKNYNLSAGWRNMINSLSYYLQDSNSDLELYYIQQIAPHIFHWPEFSVQNINQFQIVKNDTHSIFYKTICKTTDYGPTGIKLYKWYPMRPYTTSMEYL